MVRDQRETELQRMRRSHRIERADRRPLGCEPGGHLAKTVGGRLIEGNDGDVAHEGVDQAIQAAGTSALGAEAKLGQRDGAQAQVRRLVAPDLLGDASLSPQREAHALGVEQELQAKGSRTLESGSCFGRSMGSFH